MKARARAHSLAARDARATGNDDAGDEGVVPSRRVSPGSDDARRRRCGVERRARRW